MERLPKNLIIKWTQGTKSIVEVTTRTKKGNLTSIEWHEDKEGKQLTEKAMILWFRAAITLALQKPDKEIVFLRCDLESEPETENNRPFTNPRDVKTIRIAGYTYKSRMG